MTDVLMPKLSDSMEEGTILSWLKADGDAVAVGDELLEIETDKAAMAYVAEVAGTLTRVAAEGDSVAVGEVIARIGVAAPPARAADDPGADEPPAAVAEPPATPVAAGVGAGVGASNGGGVRASPLARRLAHGHGIALEGLTGTGPRGRIVRGDVEAAAGIVREPASPPRPAPAANDAAGEPARASPVAAASAPGAKGAVTRVAPSRQQQLVARRMAEAKATVPDFQVVTDADMSATVELRAELKALGADGPVPSFNDFVLKAAAVALREHPRANAAFKDGAFELYENVNVGMAVAADDALVVPTIFAADAKSLGQIARDSRRLAALVREGRIAPPDLSGGTFTVSNLGMFGMTSISPIINGGQAAILGVGAMRQVLARREGEIVERHLVTLTLNADHRILYGADASRFLGRIRELLETPLLLAL